MAEATLELEAGANTGIADDVIRPPESLDSIRRHDFETDDSAPPRVKPRRMHREARQRRLARARRLLKHNIEYIWSDEFTAADSAAHILKPTPPSPKPDADSSVKPPPEMPPYLASLYRFPLLTPEQERHLFRKLNYLKYRAVVLRESLDPEDPDPALMDQIERLLRRSLKVRNVIIRANLRLVVSIAKRLVDQANSFDDLVSDGNVPLVRAVEIFDFERGTRFSTYATWAIRNTLHRTSPRRRRRRQRFPIGPGGLFQSLADTRQPASRLEADHRRTVRAVNKLLAHLDERDRFIVESRFGLDDAGRPRKFREIAQQLNISTERVRQLLARSLLRLREAPEREQLEPS